MPSKTDDLAVRLLTIRCTNDITSSFKMLLSGYYQTSAMIQRDLVETLFLLEDLSHDRSRIAIWRTADDEAMWKEFQPKRVRQRLDKHYQHTSKKRDAAYKLYSDLAGHPNPKGFAMLRREGETDHNCGPFFDDRTLLATLSELLRHAIHAGEVIGGLFEYRTREDREVHWTAFIAKLDWFELFWGKSFDRAEVGKIRAAIDLM